MRPIVELLADLRVAKVRVWAEGGQLRYQAPRGALAPALLAELKARKAEVLAFCQQAQAGQADLPLEPIPRAGDLPMSLAQQRLWVLNELDGPNASYNISLALRLVGPLNLAALKDSLAALLRRHEPLRTAFVARGGEVRAEIAPAVDLPWSQVDLSHLPPESRLDEVRQQARAEASRPFDLSVPPLVRFALWRLDEADHVLLINVHHIVADGGSIEILAGEMATLYDAAAQGRAVALPPLRVQYADFAWHQRRWLAGPALRGQLDYWAKQLADLPPLLELPADHPRPPVFAAAGGACWRQRLDGGWVARLRQFAKLSGVSLNMLLLAGTALLLARYANRDDIPLACPATHRDRPELERLVGFFINTLVLRFDLSGAPSFREVLRRTRAMMTDAFAHQDVPFDKLVEALRPERNPGYPPLVQVSVAMLDGEKAKLRLAGLDAAPFDLGDAAARYDLSLEIHDLGAELEVFWIYATALFEPARVARMGRHLEILLDATLAQPDAPAHCLPLLTEAEQAQLHAWNQTAADYPQDHTLASLFEAQATRTPDRVAVTFEGASLTYAQLNARANQVAHALMGWGVRANTLVGISVERSLELVAGLLGILKAGGAYVPLDPGNPPERLRFMLEDSRVPVLLTQSHLAWPAPETGAERLCLDVPDAFADQPGHNPGPRSGPDDLAYVIYTSGSTGKPKGAMNAHRGICNRLFWMQAEYRLAADDRVLQKTPFSFDVSVWEFFWPLMVGARLVVAVPGGHQDPAYLSRTIDREAITTLHFVPPMLRTFLDAAGLPGAGTLRRILCSGEALPDDLQRTCLARLPHAGLHNLYGPTEAAVDVTYWPCRLDSPHHTVPIGRPVANTRIHILDRHLQPTPPGIPGELCIAGVQVGLGYLNRPELTAEKFLTVELFGQAERIYRTGDLARWLPDGNLEYLGRIDHQIKLRGFRIELGEIEAALCDHPDVRQAVVTVWEDPPGNKRLVAYIVGRSDFSPTPPPESTDTTGRSDFSPTPASESTDTTGRSDFSPTPPPESTDATGRSDFSPTPPPESTGRAEARPTWVAFLKERLPDYMVPSFFTVLDALPLNPNGKLDRRALPAPQATRQTESVPPRDDTEAALADIWAGLLNLERIGVHDDFFDLGGHSLLAAQIMGRVRERFGVELPTRLMFEAGTIAKLADAIAAARQAAREQAAAALKARLDAMDPDQIRELLRQKRAQPAHAR